MSLRRSELAERKNLRLMRIPADTYARPTVTGCSPSTTSPSGGNSIVITGTGFLTTRSVYFGAYAVTSFTVDSATQITAVAPAQGAGAVTIIVNTAGGCGMLAGALAYVANGVTFTTEAGDTLTTEAGVTLTTES